MSSNTSTSSKFSQIQEQQYALLQRASAGENVRDEVILSLQPCITALAVRTQRRCSSNFQRGNVIEVSDLVNSAYVAMLEVYPVAITKEKPLGYLIKVAKVTMLHSLYERTGTVLSLDMPTESEQTLAERLMYNLHLPEEHADQRFHKLHQAIDDLPEKQRTVILRCFGLGGFPAEPLYQISKQLTTKPNPRTAYYRYKQALKGLTASFNPK